MNNDFSTPDKRDVNLKDKQWSQREMEYLVRLAMDGLRRLTTQGDFTRPACLLKAMREYEIENNPVLAFLTEYKNPLGMATTEVFNDFKEWCANNGHKGISRKTKFSREVCRQYNLETRSRRDPNSKNGFERYFEKPKDVTY